MAKKEEKNSQITRNIKEASNFDKAAKAILSIIDKNYSERNLLSSKDEKFQSIINRELDIAKGVSQGSVVDFITSIRSEGQKISRNPAEVDTSTLFTKDVQDIFGYFQDIYKNKFIEMNDLKFITKFIPSIGEAINTTLDAIVSSDDVSGGIITRNIILPNSLSEDEKSEVMDIIEKFENDYKLHKKLKNTVFKKTLVTGNYYVYAISYNELFEEFERVKNTSIYQKNRYVNPQSKMLKNGSKKDSGFNIKANESFNNNEDEFDIKSNVTSALESFLSSGEDKLDKKDITKITSALESHLGDFYVDTECHALFEAFESYNSLTMYKKSFPENEELKNKDMAYVVDGTKNINGSDTAKNKYNLTGTYIKYIEAKNIIPLKIFNEIIGYYHIHSTPKKRKSASGNDSLLSLGSAIFSSVNLTEKKKEDAINNIADEIAAGIMQKFSSKFVSTNSEHKKMIADCIIANGIIDNDFNIQFIPAQYIIQYKVNEDEEGVGESVIANSLFPAKLLLSLIICKLLNYFNKGGNKTIAHVHKGPIDVSSSNQIQRVTRMMQESNITFNDLLSTNLVFSKFTRDSNIQLPTAKNGDKLVEFEVQDGQSIDMHTDMEDKLEQMALLGTPVPPLLMETINQVDFAKQVVSSHIKFAGRVASYQGDLEEPTTDLYRIILKNSELNEELKTKCINSLYYKLPRPKVLSNANNSDYISTLMSTAETIASIWMGQADQDKPSYAKIKDQLIKGIIMDNAPFFNWNKVGEIFDKAMVELASPKKDDEETDSGI